MVLGNGPSLCKENIVPGATLFGVNFSYRVAHADLWATVDYDCWKHVRRIFRHPRAFPTQIYLRESALHRDPTILPGTTIVRKFRGNSGLFALSIAQRLGFETIYLLGFDPESPRKFYGQHHGGRWDQQRQWRELWRRRRDPRLWRFKDGVYRPLRETLDDSLYR